MDPMIGQSLDEVLGDAPELQMSGSPNSMLAADIASSMGVALQGADINALQSQFNAAVADYQAPQTAPSAEQGLQQDFKPAAPGTGL